MNILHKFWCILFGDFCIYCHKTRTKNHSKICDSCEEEIFMQKRIEEIKKQRDIICPIDNGMMEPKIISIADHKRIVFICNVCHSVLINEKDLELIENEVMINNIVAMDIKNAIYTSNHFGF